jgi:small GTP-binding protein
MLGSLAGGKTSIISRFVSSAFSDDYLSTIGVKISKKALDLDGREINLRLWDLMGRDDHDEVNVPYLKGASGLLLIIDGTREKTLAQALEIRESCLKFAGLDTPHLFLVNKSDLREEWRVSAAALDDLRDKGCEVLEVSAKTGENVEKAFELLTRLMLENDS